MKTEDQHVAIAGALGWRVVDVVEVDGGKRYGFFPELKLVTDSGYLPNYTEDLNACAEMVKVLTSRQREVFASILCGSIEVPGDGYLGYIELPPLDVFDCTNATPLQRCAAFLKTLGLWNPSVN